MVPLCSTLDLATSWGPLKVVVDRGAVVKCMLPMRVDVRRRAPIVKTVRYSAVNKSDRACLHQAEEFVVATLAGLSCSAPPVRMPVTAAFWHRVWSYLLGIDRGQVKTYGDVARGIGSPRGARAVGLACGRNPVPLFIPCHRVVAGRGPGGYSGGLAWKRWLLAREGVGLKTQMVRE